MLVKWKHLGRYLKQYIFKTNRLSFLTFFISSRCNLSCGHCFFWKELNSKPTDEMTLEEIELVCRNLGVFDKLSITGGEPYIEPDIVPVVRMFYEINHIRHLTIPTNGWLRSRILESVEEICKYCQNMKFYTSVSIDGFSDTHDKIRGKARSYEKAISTLGELNRLRKRFKNLIVGATATMSTANQYEVEALYEHVTQSMGINVFVVNAIRGDVKDPTFKLIDGSCYHKFVDKLNSRLLRRELRPIGHQDIATAVETLRYTWVDKAINEGKYITPCYAGKFNAILYRNGDVYPCEMLSSKFGNVRDESFDFKRLWQSGRVEDIRKFIKDSKCACFHDCMVINNIVFNPRFLPHILSRYLRIKAEAFKNAFVVRNHR